MSDLAERPDGGDDRDVGLEWIVDDLPFAAVRALFVTLGKAFRAFQLYDENNPVRRRFLESLRGEIQQLWAEVDELTLSVDEDHFYLEGQEVYRSESRADSLAFLFFKDGIREITFLPGIEAGELERFLGVLQRARKLVPEGDDLLTVLWEEDLHFFRYQYVDLLAEGIGLPEGGGGNSQAELQAVLEAEGVDERAAGGSDATDDAGPPGPQTVSQDDFNPTLYALDQRDMDTLRCELRKELERDTRADVLNALFDRLEEPRDRARQSEILKVLATLLPNFLSRGALVAATSVLQELRKLEAREDVFDEQRRAESQRMLDEVSAPETISEVIRALYDGTIRATPSQLGGFLAFLRGGALAPLLRASESVDHKELRAVLREAVQGIASRNRSAVLELLDEPDAVVAAGAARLAGAMQIAEAAPALARLLAHREARVRLAAVEAAVSLRASTTAAALEDVMSDDDRDVRIAAARALGVLRYRPASRTLAAVVGSRAIRSADISEKVAVFEAYGLVAGDEAVRPLEQLLNGRSFLGKREPSEIRAAAALGLGQIGGEAARAALEKAAHDEDPVVRSNVGRALRSEER